MTDPLISNHTELRVTRGLGSPMALGTVLTPPSTTTMTAVLALRGHDVVHRAFLLNAGPIALFGLSDARYPGLCVREISQSERAMTRRHGT